MGGEGKDPCRVAQVFIVSSWKTLLTMLTTLSRVENKIYIDGRISDSRGGGEFVIELKFPIAQ
jgi:hypothetical protein